MCFPSCRSIARPATDLAASLPCHSSPTSKRGLLPTPSAPPLYKNPCRPGLPIQASDIFRTIHLSHRRKSLRLPNGSPRKLPPEMLAMLLLPASGHKDGTFLSPISF